jgi:hypothetical protein
MTDMCNAVAMRLGSAGASLATPSKSAMGLVWTAPGWQGLSSRFAALVGAAMRPAF